jgi:DNA-binding NarL/FixJ family response regulator
MNKLRVMLVDDHAVLRAGLRMLINNQADMEVVAEADSTRGALEQACTRHPDVLVLDLTLPGGGSLALIERLARLEVAPRVLVLTMHDDPAYVRAALAAGGTGYVVKTVGEQDLLEAIREVSRGRLIVDLDDQALTASVFGSLTARKSSDPAVLKRKLSDREFDVLRRLGQGFSNQDVAEQLDLSPKTVATYRARIAEKLGLKSTADFVKFVVDTGLLGTRSDLS